ncbi:DNA-processing protein DprA [Glutamicibacter creatinolyticus]|uniref:DNA-processing protein DprA n=1 Tax=Glutamicibacter creatinolyticus TaxID=162496 RepID=UPI0031D23574
MSPAMYAEHDAAAERRYTDLSFLIEANDHIAGALLSLLDAGEALELIRRQDWYPKDLESRVHQALGISTHSDHSFSFTSALRRWRKRLPYLPAADSQLELMCRNNGGLILPADPGWPAQLNDLGFGAPICLWWRAKNPELLITQDLETSVAIVGSRDSSDYGNQATSQLATGLRQAGATIISGGAYGIDACAHRAALQVEEASAESPSTIAILAGGLDRLYPSGNHNLLRTIIDRGLLLSEVPPGTAPTRFRFLNRNRMIAGFAQLVVVTEARFRSGALNTARQAVDLGREVAALPGSVFSPNSVGTHRLIRAGEAGLVTNVEDALELLPALSATAGTGSANEQPARATDGLNGPQNLILDVLPRRGAKLVDELCALSGLPAIDTIRALSILEGRGQARQEGFGWKRIGA